MVHKRLTARLVLCKQAAFIGGKVGQAAVADAPGGGCPEGVAGRVHHDLLAVLVRADLCVGAGRVGVRKALLRSAH
jgi:hypothetical protein